MKESKQIYNLKNKTKIKKNNYGNGHWNILKESWTKNGLRNNAGIIPNNVGT